MIVSPITKIRKGMGLTMKAFAKLINLSILSLNNVERGFSRIPLKAYEELTAMGHDFFQLSIEQEAFIRERGKFHWGT